MRFLRDQHLRRPAEFLGVRARGLRRECGAFLLQLRVFTEDERTPVRRLGVIASKRVGKAHERNRAKRLLRETFRNHQDLLPPNCDLVLVARRRLLSLSQAECDAHFVAQVERMNHILASRSANEAEPGNDA